MSKKDILKAFKALRRISEQTFQGDKRAILEARQRMKLEFRKEIKAEEKIEEKLKVAKDVGQILRTQVVQAVKNPENANYGEISHIFTEPFRIVLTIQLPAELKLRKETAKLDNVIFKEDAIMPPPRSKKCKPDAS
jgi:complex III assembly factor LYRM7